MDEIGRVESVRMDGNSNGAYGAATLTNKYKPYPAYKPSGVAWIGEIPAHWEVRRLKYLSTVNDEALAETTDPNMEMAYVDIGNVDSVAGITCAEDLVFEDAPSRVRRIVRNGDVIISTVRTYLKAIAQIEPTDANLIVGLHPICWMELELNQESPTSFGLANNPGFSGHLRGAVRAL